VWPHPPSRRLRRVAKSACRESAKRREKEERGLFMMTREDFKNLSAASGNCLTIYHPVHAGDAHSLNGGPDYGFVIREATRQMKEGGLNAVKREEMLRP